jgi:pyrroloquinoline quinone biosynthesis protein A
MENRAETCVLEPRTARRKQWIAPAYCDVRLGFEVTAYVYVR